MLSRRSFRPRPLSRRRAFLAGVASIGEGMASLGEGMASIGEGMASLAGVPPRGGYRPLSYAEAVRRDREALASDFQVVGDTLRSVMAPGRRRPRTTRRG